MLFDIIFAFFLDRWPAILANCAGDTTSQPKLLIGTVRNGLALLLCDIILDDVDNQTTVEFDSIAFFRTLVLDFYLFLQIYRIKLLFFVFSRFGRFFDFLDFFLWNNFFHGIILRDFLDFMHGNIVLDFHDVFHSNIVRVLFNHI